MFQMCLIRKMAWRSWPKELILYHKERCFKAYALYAILEVFLDVLGATGKITRRIHFERK